MKKSLLILFFALISFGASGGSIYGNTWHKQEITVCFEEALNVKIVSFQKELQNINFKEKHKVKIKNILNQEFTPEKTGIHFVGFETCTKSGSYDVRIRRFKYNFFQKAFGGGAVGESHVGPIYGGNVVSLRRLKRSTILHEFLHLAGLHHEHIRDESKQCLGSDREAEKKAQPVMTIWGDFDPESVTSYCNSNKTLSAQDKEILLYLYAHMPLN